MEKIIDNGNGTCTVNIAELKQFYEAHIQVIKDIEKTIAVVAKILQILAIIDKDGSMNKDFRMRHLIKSLTDLVSQSMFGSGSLEKKFSFVTDPEVMKIIERYSYVYRAGAGETEHTPFEEIFKNK